MNEIYLFAWIGYIRFTKFQKEENTKEVWSSYRAMNFFMICFVMSIDITGMLTISNFSQGAFNLKQKDFKEDIFIGIFLLETVGYCSLN